MTSLPDCTSTTGCYALFLVLQRDVLRRLPWTTVIAWAFVFGTVPVVPLAWRDLGRFFAAPTSTAVWIGLGYIVLLSTFLGYALNTWAMQRSSPTIVAAYSTAQPFFAAAMAVAFLGERIGWEEGVGFTGISLGLLLVNRERTMTPPPPPPLDAGE